VSNTSKLKASMQQNSSFFAEFPSISKDDWLKKISKELKDKSIQDLQWNVGNGIMVDSFGHQDDFEVLPIALFSTNKSWKINETIQFDTPTAMNQQALRALNGGAESLTFIFDELPDVAAFSICFEGIFMDYVDLQFGGKAIDDNPSVFFFLLKLVAERKGLQSQQLQGALLFDLTKKTGILDWRYLADLMTFQIENFPKFKIIEADCTDLYAGMQGCIAELSGALHKGNTYLSKLSKFGSTPNLINDSIQFTFAIGTSYFLEIAKLRAFRILWLQILKAWQVPLVYPNIQVQFALEAYDKAVFTNMIRATSLAMSAVVGGADTLTVRHFAEGKEHLTEYSSDFGRRIALNVQHLLKLESGFEKIGDVAAGSYYIEKLTTQLAEAAWVQFKKA
jgi:methylmalonyl-CoA mutase